MIEYDMCLQIHVKDEEYFDPEYHTKLLIKYLNQAVMSIEEELGLEIKLHKPTYSVYPTSKDTDV